MEHTNIDHDTFRPLAELEADATFVELIEHVNKIVQTVNAIVVAVNGAHDVQENQRS
jgi:hypothetical protein